MNFNSARNRSVAAGLMIALVAPITASAHIPSPPKKDEIGRRVVKKPVSDFVLTDQSGKSFRLADQRGKVIAVTFIYTRCPDVCPLLSARFSAMDRSLAGKKQRIICSSASLPIPKHQTPQKIWPTMRETIWRREIPLGVFDRVPTGVAKSVERFRRDRHTITGGRNPAYRIDDPDRWPRAEKSRLLWRSMAGKTGFERYRFTGVAKSTGRLVLLLCAFRQSRWCTRRECSAALSNRGSSKFA